MKTTLSILVLLAIICQFQAYKTVDFRFSNAPVSNQKIEWFEHQILDHFNPMPPIKNWKQRFFVLDEYYDQDKGPLFLYICGEGECRGIPKDRSYTAQLAKKYKGIAIALEHRFYGESQPFGQDSTSYATEKLKFLTHDQGLADLAVFIGHLKKNGLYGISHSTPVITVGGSYPGAMSAWFRYKYRHLTIGAYSSSGVVNAILDFQDYDKQIGISASYSGAYCPEDIKALNKYVARQLTSPASAEALKKIFQAEKLSNDEFLEMFADVFSGLVQYGRASFMCETLLKNKPIQQQLLGLATQSSDPDSYTVSYMQDTSYDHGKNARQWTYQTCTAFGWFQSADKKNPFRDLRIDVEYFLKKCKEVYGNDYTPNVPLTNIYMGATEMRVDNIVFTNGGEDPWQWASITKDEGSMKAYVAECQGCGHCCDLGTPKSDDPVELKYVRTQVERNIDQWLSEYRQQIYGEDFKNMDFGHDNSQYDEELQQYIDFVEGNTESIVQRKITQELRDNMF